MRERIAMQCAIAFPPTNGIRDDSGMDFLRSNLRRLMGDRSVKEVGEQSGVGQPWLHRVLNPDKLGGINSPRLDKVMELAEFFSVAPADLLFRDLGGGQPLSASQLARPDPEKLEDAMAFLDELDAVLGRKPSPRPDPFRLVIAYEVVSEGEIVDGRSVVVRLADRLREWEVKRGDESGTPAGAGTTDGGAHERRAAQATPAAGGGSAGSDKRRKSR